MYDLLPETIDNFPQPTRSSRWLKIYCLRPAAAVRLYCFAHVGGTAAVYKHWPEFLSADLELCAVQLPGREERHQESLCDDMDTVVKQLLTVILSDARPCIFFGHSFGSILAFALASRLKKLGREPEMLIVSAKTAPHLPSKKLRSNLPRVQLLQELLSMGGTPASVLSDSAIMDRVLRIVRADYAVLESFRLSSYCEPLHCPIIAFAAVDDPYVSSAGVDAWGEYTDSTFVTHLLAGGHFYINNLPPKLFAVINSAAANITARV